MTDRSKSIGQSKSARALALRDHDPYECTPVMVSICTITYQHAQFISEAIEGFLSQEVPFAVEIIIYDDASTDGTTQTVERYAKEFPHLITAILAQENLFQKGVNPYYASVFPRAKGKYIAICDGDDYWPDPHKLASQVAELEANPDIAVVYGRAHAISDTGVDEAHYSGAERDLSPLDLKTCPGINTLTACFRNPLLGAPPPFLRNSPIGDQTVWAIVGHLGSGRFMPDLPSAAYRKHAGGILSLQHADTQAYMALTAQTCVAGYQNAKGDAVAERLALLKASRQVADRVGLWELVRSVVGQRMRDYLRPAWKRLNLH